MKRISSFMPSALATAEEAEAHYDRIHHAFGRYFLGRASNVVRYVTHRALGQYDINGRFEQRPDVWRFVLTENVVTDASNAAGWLPPDLVGQVWQDHTKFLRDLASYEVDEQIAADRRSGQTTFVKYMFWHVADSEDDADGARRTYLDRLAELKQHVEPAFGFRLLVSNTVLRQLESAAIAEPAQKFTGGYFDRSHISGIDELYFDSLSAGAEFFSAPAVRALLRPRATEIRGYLVSEQTGLDRR